MVPVEAAQALGEADPQPVGGVEDEQPRPALGERDADAIRIALQKREDLVALTGRRTTIQNPPRLPRLTTLL
jgi:hypothetical protein